MRYAAGYSFEPTDGICPHASRGLSLSLEPWTESGFIAAGIYRNVAITLSPITTPCEVINEFN